MNYRDVMRETGLTAADLSRALGFHRQTVARMIDDPEYGSARKREMLDRLLLQASALVLDTGRRRPFARTKAEPLDERAERIARETGFSLSSD